MNEKCHHWRIHSESYVNACVAECQDCGKRAKVQSDWKEGARPDQLAALEKLLSD